MRSGFIWWVMQKIHKRVIWLQWFGLPIRCGIWWCNVSQKFSIKTRWLRELKHLAWCLMIVTGRTFKQTMELRLRPWVPTLASHGLFIALGSELQRQQTSESLYSHQSSLSLWTLYDLPLCSGRLAGSAHSGISIFTLKRQNVLFFATPQWEAYSFGGYLSCWPKVGGGEEEEAGRDRM